MSRRWPPRRGRASHSGSRVASKSARYPSSESVAASLSITSGLSIVPPMNRPRSWPLFQQKSAARSAAVRYFRSLQIW